MDTKVIDGKALAKKHEDALKEKLVSIKKNKQSLPFSAKKGRNPMVVSFCNQDDPPSVKYTFMKMQKAKDIGIDFVAEEFSANTPEAKLAKLVKKYANNLSVDGILVQLPLPEELNPFKEELLNLIPPEKDVDGLTGKGLFLSATVKGVISILDEYIKDWQGKIIAIVGATGEVGGEMIVALKKMGLKPLEISRRANNFNELKKAQIIISVTGQLSLIKVEMISSGVVLIDVGLGDFNPKCYEKAEKYTPITGGVGPMTVISLMENVVESYERRMIE